MACRPPLAPVRNWRADVTGGGGEGGGGVAGRGGGGVGRDGVDRCGGGVEGTGGGGGGGGVVSSRESIADRRTVDSDMIDSCGCAISAFIPLCHR